MSKIRIDLEAAVINGQALTFKSPADSSAIEGLVIYYPEGGSTISSEFKLVDAHGVDVGSGTISLFSKNALVKIILDTAHGKAYVQNADTNAYLEEQLAKKYSPDNKPSKSDVGLGNVPNVSTNDQTPTYTQETVINRLSSGEKLSVALGKIATAIAYLIDHLANKNNPHGVTAAQVGASPTGHKHSKSEITDFPSSMTPTAHNQAASTITAGTFAGQVVANSGGQTPGTSLIRNSKLVSADTNPTANGEICWTYE